MPLRTTINDLRTEESIKTPRLISESNVLDIDEYNREKPRANSVQSIHFDELY